MCDQHEQSAQCPQIREVDAIYMAFEHPERGEKIFLWFEAETGDYIQGFLEMSDGTKRDLESVEAVEAAMMGVIW